MSEKPRKKMYWTISGCVYVILAAISLAAGSQVLAVGWTVCGIVCVATQDILNAINRT